MRISSPVSAAWPRVARSPAPAHVAHGVPRAGLSRVGHHGGPLQEGAGLVLCDGSWWGGGSGPEGPPEHCSGVHDGVRPRQDPPSVLGAATLCAGRRVFWWFSQQPRSVEPALLVQPRREPPAVMPVLQPSVGRVWSLRVLLPAGGRDPGSPLLSQRPLAFPVCQLTGFLQRQKPQPRLDAPGPHG